MDSLATQLLLVVLVAIVLLLVLAESWRPFRRAVAENMARRWWANLALTAGQWGLGLYAGPWLAWGLMRIWPSDEGLLQRLGAGPWLTFVVLVLVLQLLAYGMHRLAHAWPVLWRFHAVHHSDTELDVTTAHRHHPVEALVNLAVTVPVLLCLRPDAWALLASSLLHTVVALVSHSNLSFGQQAAWVRWLVVTPDLHRLHHSTDPRYTNSNYATLLPVLDLLFRTATWRPVVQQESMTLGLEYFRAPADSGLWRLLTLPFVRVWPRPSHGDSQH